MKTKLTILDDQESLLQINRYTKLKGVSLSSLHESSFCSLNSSNQALLPTR